MASCAAVLISPGAAKSGKPCARLMALCRMASRVISRITDSVKPAVRRLRNRSVSMRACAGASDGPVWRMVLAPFGPVADDVGEVGLVENPVDGIVHLPPRAGEWSLAATSGSARTGRPRAFHVAQHFSDRDRLRRARQHVSSVDAASGFDEAALLQRGQNQLQKFLRNFAAPGDLADLHRAARAVHGEVEDGLQRVFTLD